MNQFPASNENHNPARKVTCWPGDDPMQDHRESEERKVQRPDAQDAADVKRTHVQRARQVLLAEQEFGDQVRTQHEKQTDAECTGRAYASHNLGQKHWKSQLRPERGVMRKGVVQEHHQEGKETQHIQFRMVEPGGGGSGTFQGAYFRTGCGDRRQYSIL